jgi:hypothetical protein
VWVPVSIKQRLAEARVSQRQTVTQIVLAAIQAHHEAIKTAAATASGGGVAKGLFVQQVSPRRRDLEESLTQITLLLVAANQEAIDRLADEAGMNRSSFVTEALRRHLSPG